MGEDTGFRVVGSWKEQRIHSTDAKMSRGVMRKECGQMCVDLQNYIHYLP